jgi:hypothetical protein
MSFHWAQTFTVRPPSIRQGRVLAQYEEAFGRGTPTHMGEVVGLSS